jgi:RNA polymerase sigma-B factor
VSAATIESAKRSTDWDPQVESLSRNERTRRLLKAAAVSTSASERAHLEVQVIETNMPVAAQVAARYRGRGVAADDLEQVAYLALVKAVRRYEYAPDREFLSFAVPTIRGEIRRYFRDVGWAIRPTRQIQDAQARIGKAEGDLLQKLGRAPRPSEIAEHLNLGLDVVVEALSANGCFSPSSLESTMTDDEGRVTEWLGVEDAGFDNVEARVMLRSVLETLTPRERTMLEMRFFKGATQAEIGAVIGVTQMQVSRLLADLMARLRDELTVQQATAADEREPVPA